MTDLFTAKMKLAVKIYHLAEVLKVNGVEPLLAGIICRGYFSWASDPLYHAALKEALDMMTINGWTD